MVLPAGPITMDYNEREREREGFSEPNSIYYMQPMKLIPMHFKHIVLSLQSRGGLDTDHIRDLHDPKPDDHIAKSYIAPQGEPTNIVLIISVFYCLCMCVKESHTLV